MAEHQLLAQKGAQLVELRLDWLATPPDLPRLINNRPTPVVVTCRREVDKGRWKGTEEQRQTLLRAAIVAGVEYVDLEEDTAKGIRRYGKTKRIVSYHNFEETPHDLEAIHNRLTKLDPDVIKIVTMAHTPVDSIRMLRLLDETRGKVPTVGFCMGELGIFTRILAGKFGAPFTYATFNKDRELAPGQLSYDEMVKLYRYDQINPETEIYGILGDPVGHSLSPLIHNMGFKKLGLNKVYVPFRVSRDMFTMALNQFDWLKVQGFSVTIPHKEAVLTRTENYEGPVREIGAANTLFHKEDGKWWATNTDYDAALQSLALAGTSPEGQTPKPEEFLSGRKVLLLGAGGVARAIGLGVLKCGAELTITNRTSQRGLDLAKELGCKFVTWENRGSVLTEVVVNCTALGMHPDVNQSPMQDQWLREGTVVFDTVYNPEQTLLLKQAKQRGCKTVSGVEMFIRQAVGQFKRFAGKEISVEFMREHLKAALSSVKTQPSPSSAEKTSITENR